MSNTSAGYKAALDFNSKAVACLALGNHRGCTVELENALKAYRSFLHVADVRVTEVQHEQVHASRVRLKSIPLPDSVAELPQFGHNKSPTLSQFACGNIFTVFCRAFVVTGDVEQGLAAATPEHLVPAIILYNMGLSFHLHAIRVGSTIGMVRAYEFYRHSVALVETRTAVVDVSRQRLLLAALALNMAHISSAFYHGINTRTSMVLLRNLIFDAGRAQEDFDEDEMDVFTMNWIYFSEYQHLTMAPSA